MATDFTMPKLGLTMDEGTVVRWLAAEGDTVTAGQVILEVQTDKVTVEVEAPAGGVLGSLLVGEGQTVPVGALLTRITAPGEEARQRPRVTPLARRIAAQAGIDLTTMARSQERITAADVRVLAEAGTKRFSSPRARKQAREAGIDWRRLQGSGPRGRVIERDVLAVARLAPQPATTPAAPSPAQASAPGQGPAAKEDGGRGGVRWEEPTLIQRIGADRTTATWAAVPHFHFTTEASAEALVEMRERLLPAVERRAGVRLTITDLLVKIAAIALVEHPRVNAFWNNGRIGFYEAVDIGIATATDGGLVVPVLRDANRLQLSEIARERARLVEAARNGKLSPDDATGGTFTITNLGAHRVDQFQPVLNSSPGAAQSVILATGRIEPRPVAANGQLIVARTIFLTIACDHRALDGAAAAAFFDRLIELIEEPYELLI